MDTSTKSSSWDMIMGNLQCPLDPFPNELLYSMDTPLHESNSSLQTHEMPQSFHVSNSSLNKKDEEEEEEEEEEELGAMKEMMYKLAVMQPVDIDPATIRKPKRRNVRISNDPQSIAARHRRERISERIRILQRLVPGGTKMDTASMLDEAIRYVKFLKKQVQELQSTHPPPHVGVVPPLLAGNWIEMASTSSLGHVQGVGFSLAGDNDITNSSIQ